VPQRQGNTHPSLAPYQTFETLDGAMLLASRNGRRTNAFAPTPCA